MDLPTAAAAPIVRTINDQQVTFRPLRLCDLATLLNRWKEADRQTLLADLETAALEPADKFKALREFGADLPTAADAIRRVFNPEGARDVLALAVTGDVDAIDLPVDELVTLAAELCGFRVAPVTGDDAPQPAEASGPDPTSEAPTGTGS